MALTDQINEDIKTAMKAKDRHMLEALRAIKSALLLEATKTGGGESIPDDVANKLLQKQHKQRVEAAEIYKQQGREDLADDEMRQAEFIGKYLPEAMSEDEIREVVRDIIGRVGASSPADMGKVMGVASKDLAGRADGKVIANIVKDELS